MKEISRCKFCGSVVNSGHASCGECTKYCMTKCKIASSTTTSWHREPCTKCEHNPYNRTQSPAAIPGRSSGTNGTKEDKTG